MVRIVLAIGLAALAAGCGAGGSDDGGLDVVASFYPLALAAQGPGIDVRNLTPPGAEPHDIELTPKDVAALQRAKVVLYLSHDFQPAIEQAVEGASGTKVDVLSGLKLRSGAGDESGRADPHVWLDPVLYEEIVRRIGRAVGQPRVALVARLRALNRDYRTGLAHCARRDFVTSHAAFGYLAARYGLTQIPITGIDPESEPNPRRLADLARLVEREHITTVFFERLVSPRIAETVAREAGAETAVLDPIEGLTKDEARRGDTYLTLMRHNLTELRKALGCR